MSARRGRAAACMRLGLCVCVLGCSSGPSAPRARPSTHACSRPHRALALAQAPSAMAARMSKRARVATKARANWGVLDGAMLGGVFGFLSLQERFVGAGAVCRAWAGNERAAWRCVRMPKRAGLGDAELVRALRAAAGGQVVSVVAGYGTSDAGGCVQCLGWRSCSISTSLAART